MSTGRHRLIREKLTRTGGPLGVLIVVLAMVAALLGLTGPAFAAPTTAITIAQSSPATQESGETFEYSLNYQCSDVDGATCNGGVITIPLGAAADWDIQIPSGTSIVQSWVVDGSGNLVITLQPGIDAGTSSSINLQITPPNLTTPDGTSWTLAPTITGANTAPTTAPGVTSTATAELDVTVSKSSNKTFVQTGGIVRWRVDTSCQLATTGGLAAGQLVVVDQLPPEFVYASSTGGGVYDSVAHTVTWTYDADPLTPAASLPDSCTTAGGAGYTTGTVSGTIDPSTPEGSVVNHVDATATPFDGSAPALADAQAQVTVLVTTPPGPGPISKTGYGQLAGPMAYGDPRMRDYQLTYPGRWAPLRGQTFLGHGSFTVNAIGPTTAYYTELERVAGMMLDVHEPMPCRTGPGPIYTSQTTPRCTTPAFHPTTVQVENGDPVLGAAYPPIDAIYAVLTGGATVPLIHAGGGLWNVPAANVGDVAEIQIEQWGPMEGDYAQVWIEGYADAASQDGDVLRNVITVDEYWNGSLVGSPSHHGDIYVTSSPQIGTDKTFGPVGGSAGGATAVNLQGLLNVYGVATDDYVLSDLLPAGMTSVGLGATAPVTLSVTEDSGTTTVPVDLGVEVIPNFGGTGRELVRFTLPQSYFAGHSSAQYRFPLTFDVTTPSEPGTYHNTVASFYDDPNLHQGCLAASGVGTPIQAANDPSDLNGNGSTTDNHCDSTASITVPGSLSGPEFKLTKTVQGDQDPLPKLWPGIGQVDATGGSVTFGLNWKNVAAKPINDVVLYDVFPHVGDTGVSGSLATQPRNSEFDATFVSVGTIPAGVSVAYTTAANPCRDEVYADSLNVGCVDDSSTTVPADPSTVTGIRVLAPGTFAAGAGFGLTYTMTTPAIDQGDIAWNSVAGVADNAENGARMLVTEPPKVGLTAAGEDPIIAKEVDLTTAEPGDTLTYTVTLTNPASVNASGLTVTDTLPDGVTFVSASDSGTYDAGTGVITWTGLGIPGNGEIELTVQVTVDAGFTGVLENCASSPQAVPTETCATTTVDDGVLVVEKVVDGPAASYGVGPFDFTVDCRVGGASLTGFPQDVSLPGAGTSSPIAVPLGATCTAVETEDGGATETVLAPAGGVEITDSTTTFTLTATNTFEEGALVINKQLTGAGAAEFGSGPFEFDVSCVFEGVSVYDDTVVMSRVASETTLTSDPIEDLPSGAVCTVTETENGGADATPAPVTVTIDDTATDATVYADLTNVFSAGTLELTKVLAGPAAGSSYVAGLEFTIAVTCQVDTVDSAGDPVRATVFSGPVTIRGGQTVPIEDSSGDAVMLPIGTHCWAEETDDRGADGVEVDATSWADAVIVDGGTPSDLQELSITATNTFAKRVPGYVTTVSDKAVMVGDTVLDRVVVAGLVAGESVQLHWQLYGPYASRAAMTCQPGKVYAEGTMPVSANGVVSTPAVTLRKAGYYTYVQSSAATDTYVAQRTACGIDAETTRVQEGAVKVRTESSAQRITVGASVTDKVVITGLPAGTTAKVTGYLYGPFETEKAIRCTKAHAYKKVTFTATGNAKGTRTYRTSKVRVLEPGWFSWSMTVPRTALTKAATEGCGQAKETLLATRQVLPTSPEVPTGLTGEEPDSGVGEETLLDQVAELVDAADGVVDGNIPAGEVEALPVISAERAEELASSQAGGGATQPRFAVAPQHVKRLYSPPNGRGVSKRRAPTGLSIPGIGATAPVDTSRLVRNTMAVPKNVGRVGWLNRSAHLDDVIGSTVIAGHVSDNRDAPGALYRLRSAEVGDVVTVREKGKSYRFRITRLRTYDRSRSLPADIFSVTGKHVLNLITCTGKVTYPNGRFHYTKNLVVTAEAIR